MKRFGLLLVLLVITQILPAQNLEDQLQDNRRTVYWIQLHLSYIRDPKLKVYKYQTNLYNKRIYVGTLDQFQQQIWRGRSQGNYIVEGPYTYREQAQLALKVFDPRHAKDTALLNDKKTYYWYLVRIGQYQRLHAYYFVHIPAAVAQGTLKDFLATMKTAQYNQSVVIGPFATRIEAELSKRLYRREE